MTPPRPTPADRGKLSTRLDSNWIEQCDLPSFDDGSPYVGLAFRIYLQLDYTLVRELIGFLPFYVFLAPFPRTLFPVFHPPKLKLDTEEKIS